MNTPEPCCRCKHLLYDCLQEDGPVECKLISLSDRGIKPVWADKDCPKFECYDGDCDNCKS